MRIIYDHQIFTWQTYGGISRYYYEIANRIAAMEDDVEIFSPFYVNKYFHKDSQIHPFGFKIPRFSKYIRAIPNIVNEVFSHLLIKRRRDVDIFHETYYSINDNCPLSAKRVITIHDMIHEKYARYFPAQDKTRKHKAHAVGNADHIICVSENTRRDLMDLLNVPEEKISVVYHGYTLSCSRNDIKTVNNKKPFVLYVGKRDGYKNFELILRAFSNSQLLQKEISIVCFGGGKTLAQEKELLRLLRLPSDCVTYIDGNDHVLAGLYASAKAFIYPSLYEGFGIPLLEAMALGCPVLCSNTSSIPEVVGNAALLFDPKDAGNLQIALEKVVFSSDCSETLKVKGYERIKLFSWEKCAEETLRVYKHVLERST